MWLAALSIARKNWQAIAVAVVIGIIWWRISAIVGERDEAIAALNAQTKAIDVATAEQRAKNAELKRQGAQNVAAIEAQHIQDIQHIAKQFTKGWNHDNAVNRGVIANLRGELADRVREQSAENDRARVSEDDANRLARPDGHPGAAGPGEESPEFYKAAYHGAQQYIETLEQAGAMCAADYNMCKGYVDSEQARLGVEGKE